MESKQYVTAEELLAENLQLHEQLTLAKEELSDLKTMLEIARTENEKLFRSYFQVSEKLRMYENKDKLPLFKRLTQ